MSSPLLRDLQRLAHGVSLVALEAAKRSPLSAAAAAGPTTLIKAAVGAVTDLAGLTKGTPRQVNDEPENQNNQSKDQSSSVVYFDSQNPVAGEIGDNAVARHVFDEIPLPETRDVREFEFGGNPIASYVFDKMPQKAETLDSEKVGGELGGFSSKNDGGVEDSKIRNLSGGEREVSGVSVGKKRRPRERKVPATPFSRALGFAGLGAGLLWGTIQESTMRIVYGMPESAEKQSALSPFLSEQNAERLALALCRMRGAALKLGQMLSIQDESLVPAPILAALDIVRQGADVMPRKQLNEVLDAELGPNWSSKLKSFDFEPLAAASIGQVHRAVLKNDMVVAMKIQYPGVADSIESDIDNVRRLLDYTNLIPKGLFLDRAIKVAKEELSRECDYILEAANQKRFRQLLQDSEGFYVPIVIDEMSSKKVLTTELVAGVPIDKVALLNQETRNYVGRKLLELTLKELFIYRFMQTDPNWSNFLFDNDTKMINLIDFGAAREYPKHFVDDYLRMVIACSNGDKDGVIEMSRRLGFLTGDESEVMLDAHVQAGFVVGLPFSKPGGYDFRTTNITQSVSNLGATMLKHRLTPPPDEVYSLHRKLSGAFLACMKLGAVVPCREILLQVYQQYQFDNNSFECVSTTV